MRIDAPNAQSTFDVSVPCICSVQQIVCLLGKQISASAFRSQTPIKNLIGKGKAESSVITWCTLALCISEFASLLYIYESVGSASSNF